MNTDLLSPACRHRYLLTALLSLLASLILIQQRVLVNVDGVVYLASAEALLAGDPGRAIEISPNIFLPFLIALTSFVSGDSLILASDIVNTLLYCGLSLGFVYLVGALGGTARLQLIAMVLIILHPSLSGFRDSIFRDAGYWAGCLFSVGLLLDYSRRPGLALATLWTASLILASLFRPEAMAFFAAPLACLFERQYSRTQRISRLVRLLTPVVACVVLSIVATLVIGKSGLFLEAFDHLGRYFQQETPRVKIVADGINALFSPFSQLTDPYPENALWLGVLLLTIPIFLSAFLGALSWPFVLLLAWSRWKGASFSIRQPLFTACWVIALLVVLAFLILTMFLDTRYTTLLSLFLLALLPRALSQAATRVRNLKVLQLAGAVAVFILVLDTFVSFGYSKQYLAEGVDWANANLPVESLKLSNERNVTWSLEGEKDFEDSQLAFGSWRQQNPAAMLDRYDYFVEDVSWREEPWLPDLVPGAEEVQRFSSERGNRLIIYRLP